MKVIITKRILIDKKILELMNKMKELELRPGIWYEIFFDNNLNEFKKSKA